MPKRKRREEEEPPSEESSTLTLEPSTVTEKQLWDMTVLKLRVELKKFGLFVAGTKAQLVKRLYDALKKQNGQLEPIKKKEPEPVDPNDYTQWTTVKLRKKLKEYKKAVKGLKVDLIKRLEDAMLEAGEPLYVPPAKRQKEEETTQKESVKTTPPRPKTPPPQISTTIGLHRGTTVTQQKRYIRRTRRRASPNRKSKGLVPDSQLFSAIRDHLALLEIDDSTITKSKLKSLVRIECNNYDQPDYSPIRDITGVEHCSQVTHISLQGNYISDLKPLNQLTKLKELWLARNRITNLEPLASLKELRVLDLSNNDIEDISALSDLKKLTYLNLSNAKIKDIQPLYNLPLLEELDLSQNIIKTIEWTKFTCNSSLKTLNLNNNQISDIGDIFLLENLKELYLKNNTISDVSSLPKLLRLYVVDISGNLISRQTSQHKYNLHIVLSKLQANGVRVILEE